MRKKLLLALLFLAIAFAINSLISYYYTEIIMSNSVLNRVEKRFKYYRKDIQYLVLGNSHTQFGVNPYTLGNAFNFSSGQENFINNYYKLKYILEEKEKTLDTVIINLDLNSFFRPKTKQFANAYYWVKYLDYLKLGKERGQFLAHLKAYIVAKFFPYAGQSRTVLTHFFGFKGRMSSVIIGGHLSLKRKITEITNYKSMYKSEAEHHFKKIINDNFDEEIKKYFFRIVTLCKKYKLKLVLVRLPIVKEYYEESGKIISLKKYDENIKQVINQAQEIYDFKFIDLLKHYFNNPNVENYFADPDHMNSDGAKLITEVLKEEMEGSSF